MRVPDDMIVNQELIFFELKLEEKKVVLLIVASFEREHKIHMLGIANDSILSPRHRLSAICQASERRSAKKSSHRGGKAVVCGAAS